MNGERDALDTHELTLRAVRFIFLPFSFPLMSPLYPLSFICLFLFHFQVQFQVVTQGQPLLSPASLFEFSCGF